MTEQTSFVQDDGGRKHALYKAEGVGDCVTRAIAIATGVPYALVYSGLNNLRDSMLQTKSVKASSARDGVAPAVYKKYLSMCGWKWTPTMRVGSGCKVHLRADELPKGRIIARVSGHLVAVIDGVIHDTHDSSRGGKRCVYGYWSSI